MFNWLGFYGHQPLGSNDIVASSVVQSKKDTKKHNIHLMAAVVTTTNNKREKVDLRISMCTDG